MCEGLLIDGCRYLGCDGQIPAEAARPMLFKKASARTDLIDLRDTRPNSTWTGLNWGGPALRRFPRPSEEPRNHARTFGEDP